MAINLNQILAVRSAREKAQAASASLYEAFADLKFDRDASPGVEAELEAVRSACNACDLARDMLKDREGSDHRRCASAGLGGGAA